MRGCFGRKKETTASSTRREWSSFFDRGQRQQHRPLPNKIIEPTPEKRGSISCGSLAGAAHDRRSVKRDSYGGVR